MKCIGAVADGIVLAVASEFITSGLFRFPETERQQNTTTEITWTPARSREQ